MYPFDPECSHCEQSLGQSKLNMLPEFPENHLYNKAGWNSSTKDLLKKQTRYIFFYFISYF